MNLKRVNSVALGRVQRHRLELMRSDNGSHLASDEPAAERDSFGKRDCEERLRAVVRQRIRMGCFGGPLGNILLRILLG